MQQGCSSIYGGNLPTTPWTKNADGQGPAWSNSLAKFASAGKSIGKKDIAMQAISYGNVYVARIAMGANPQQTLLSMREAEEYNGPSLILAYSPCIAHGYDLKDSLSQQYLAVDSSGYWPLIRYNPELRKAGKKPFLLDAPRPSISLKEYAYNEMRYKVRLKTNPEQADKLMELAQEQINLRWETYEYMSKMGASNFNPVYVHGDSLE